VQVILSMILLIGWREEHLVCIKDLFQQSLRFFGGTWTNLDSGYNSVKVGQLNIDKTEINTNVICLRNGTSND